MKTLCTLLAVTLLSLCGARAADTVTAVITVTNTAAVSNTLSFSGVVFTWTNGTPASSLWISTTNSAAASATNLYLALANYLGSFTNVNNVSQTNPTTLVVEGMVGVPLTVTSAGGWAHVTNITATTFDSYTPSYPLTNNPVEVRTNIHTDTIDVLNWASGTNKVSNNAAAFPNFITTRTNEQAVTNLSTRGGRHTEGTYSNILGARIKLPPVGSTVSNAGLAFLANATNDAGNVVIAPAANGFPAMYYNSNAAPADFSANYEGEYLLNMLTAAKMFGALTELYTGRTNLFSVTSWFTNAANRWVNGSVSNTPLLSGSIFGDWAIGTSEFSVTNSSWLFGADVGFYDVDSARTFVFGDDPDTGGRSTNAFLSHADFNRNQFTLGVGTYGSLSIASGAPLTNTPFYGATTHAGTNTGGRYRNVNVEAATLVATNGEIKVLTSTNATLSNLEASNVALRATRLIGINTNEGALVLGSASISTLAVGNNIVTRPTNNLVRFTGSAGATVNAITNGFGEGDWFLAWNETGAALGIAHESGFTGIDSTRLKTATGSDHSIPVNGLMLFNYEAGSVNRWRVAQLYPALSTATNTTIYTNGVSAGDGVLNFVGSAVTVTNFEGTNFIVISASGGSGNYIANTNGTGYSVTAMSAATTAVALTVTNVPGNTNHLVRVLSTNGAAALTVTADGKVGVGTNTPARPLDVIGTIVTGAGSATQPAWAFNSDTNTGFYSSADGVMNLTVDGSRAAVYTASLLGYHVNSAIGWYSASFSAFDTAMYRAGANTNGFGNQVPTATLLASNLALRGQIEITQTTSTNTPSTDSVRLWAANNGGTAELIASDEAGNVVQLTSHPADAPAAFYIATNWTRSLPRISKTVNLYLGVIEWQNETLATLLRQWELRGTNIAALPQPVRRALADALHEEETFEAYNARTGELLVQSDWAALQDQRQASWDAARAEELVRFNTPLTVTNAAGAVITLPNDTNVTVRAARDARKPMPARLDERVRQERERRGKGK